MARKQSSSQLRKQPTMRRVKSAHALPIPRVQAPQTARKRKRRNRRKRWTVHVPTVAIQRFIFSARWISLGVLALAVYALAWIGLDEHFYLTMIPVDGTVAIPAEEIVAASQLAGVHIFAVDPNRAAANVAELSGVVSAAVTLTWPNNVLIEVEEELPVAAWQDGEQTFWVTADGRFIPARATIPGLLVIESEIVEVETAVTPSPETESETADLAPQNSLAFMPEDVLEGAQQLQQLRPNIEKLYYRHSAGLSYQDERGWRVYFGAGQDMAQKLVMYETILDELLARGLTPRYISVSNQEKPYYRASE